MQIIFRLARYALPLTFFSYAAVFNFGYAQFPGLDEVAMDRTALTGALTSKLDAVYRQSLPHRNNAIGVMGALRYLAVREAKKGVVIGSDGWLFTAEEMRPQTDDLDLSLDRIVEVMNDLEAVGAQLIIVPVPGKLDVHVDHTNPETASAIAKLYDGFLLGLRERGVPVLDARAALRAQADGDKAFFPTDTHWTPRGAGDVARALASSGVVASGETKFAVATAATEQFTGDLVSFVTNESLGPKVGLPPETATPFTATATTRTENLDIFAGTQPGATMLIGTSYSANPIWSFAESLKLALNRDVLNMAVVGRGPVWPMLDYLASPQFRHTPPKLVIWEFPVRYLSDPTLWHDPSLVKRGA